MYYEQPTGPTSIQLDWVKLEISQDGSTWYTVFNWGDGVADMNTSVGPFAGAESDNTILSGDPPLFNGYGISIDIDSLGLTGSYPYLKISCPSGGSGDGCDLDSFDIYP